MRLFCSGMRRRFRPNTHGLRPFWLSWKVWVTREAAGRTAVRGYGDTARGSERHETFRMANVRGEMFVSMQLRICLSISLFIRLLFTSIPFLIVYSSIYIFIYWSIMHLNECKHVLSYAQKFLLISYKTLSNTAWHISSACRRSDGTFWMR